jgi:cobaltochelatase CobN
MCFKVVSVSVQSPDAALLDGPLRRLEEELGIRAELFSVNSEDADDDPLLLRELERRTREADFVFVRCMSDTSRFKRYDRYEESLRACGGHVFLHSGNLEVSLMKRDLFKGGDADYAVLRAFAAGRGPENDHGMLRWAAAAGGFTDLPAPEPVGQRADGIYHPAFPRDVGREEYIRGLGDGPVAGIMFPSSLWIYDNLDHIDALIGDLEAEGMRTLPVFFTVSSFSSEGSEGSRGCVREYFTDGDRVLIDVLIVCSPFSQLVNSRTEHGIGTRDDENYYRTLLNVPVIHAMTVTGDYRDFEDDRIGLGKHDISSNVAWPEIDGQIISVPIGYTPRGRAVKRAVPIPDRIGHISRLAAAWGRLRRKPVSERRVAVLLYQSRPDSGRIGAAAGLDSVESVAGLLGSLRDAGYRVDSVPGSGRELAETMLGGITNDLDNVSSETLRERAAGLMPSRDYRGRYGELPEFGRRMTEADWGEPPGGICVEGDDIVIPGIVNGNIFLGYQPMRGWAERAEADCHDPELFAQHQYIAYYMWIRDVFGADLVMHIGTHGTLEWLPGKNVGLSAKCNPDFILDGLPNLYPYIIDDPGEGIQAKRRIESVLIGHMGPTMARAGNHDELERINAPLQDYFRNRGTASAERRGLMVARIHAAAAEGNLLGEIGAGEDPGPEGFEPYIERLHDYMTEV